MTRAETSSPVETGPMITSTLGMRGGAAALDRATRETRTAQLLAQAATAAPGERQRLLAEVVELNCRIADAVAMRYRDRGISIEDLRQTAYEGLIKAVHRYKHDEADNLLTFAVPTIRGEIQRYLRDKAWLVRPPREIHELNVKVQMAVGHLIEDLGREPTPSEVCDYLGLDERDYNTARHAMANIRHDSLDRQLANDRTITLGDMVANHSSNDPMERVESRIMLEPALMTLSAADRHLLHQRFIEQRTQTDIATALGISATQVGRRLARILNDLRTTITT